MSRRSSSRLGLIPYVAASAVGGYLAWRFLDERLQLAFDFETMRSLAPTQFEVKKALANNMTLADFFENGVAQWGDKTAIRYEQQTWTFHDLNHYANQVGHWALSVAGLQKGDVAALVMENRPEYVALWMGLAKVGVEIAFINYNLTSKGLMHCLQVARTKVLILGVECDKAVSTVLQDLRQASIPVYCQGGFLDYAECIDDAVAKQPKTNHSKEIARAGVSFMDTFGYIFTSGTTGLPKAAVIKHEKMYMYGAIVHYGFKVNRDDVVYCCLPMYHSAANLAFTCMCLCGASVVIKRKFSTRDYWKDIHDYQCTATQYIGELCRYLLNAPPSQYDQKHHCRIAIGNGLRPDIWDQFQTRFNLPQIGEFYGATEGNFALINLCRRPEDRGAVGRSGFLLRKLLNSKIVQFDVEKEIPIRGPDGFCIECGPGEVGELLGYINVKDVITHFQGYTSKEASEKKIIKDAFAKGDSFFRTGDLLYRDARGYYYFVDRVGDTFRWKGENVSTAEVGDVLSRFPGVTEANVYGVALPGKDGRACAVAMVMKEDFDFAGFAQYVAKELPSYARPMFLRKLPHIDVTSTFKYQKVKLREDGVDLTKVSDDVFWFNPETAQYERFTPEAWNSIVQGRAKL